MFKFSEKAEKKMQVVFDLIDSENFLLGLPKNMINEFVITDPEEAEYYFGVATYKRVGYTGYRHRWDQLIHDLEYTYYARYYHKIQNPELFYETMAKFESYNEDLQKKIEAKFSKLDEYYSFDLDLLELPNIVTEQLYRCLRVKALSVKKNNFFEQILNIYKMGGIPCGWRCGECPKTGNFLIFTIIKD